MKSFLTVLALLFVLALLASACSSTTPTAPSAQTAALPPAVLAETLVTITYAINIPNRITFQELLTQYPDGRLMAPMTAQQLYDYTATYHVPNVYYGPLAPPKDAYAMAGIVVAPISVASVDSFPASAWPNEYGQFPKARVQWLGRFAYAVVGCYGALPAAECGR